MDLRTPLDRVFGAGSHVRVLRALFRTPIGRGLSARDVGRLSGLSHPTVLRVMPSLLDQGVVRVTRRRRLDLYELNRGHVLIPLLEALFAVEVDLLDSVIRFLARRLPEDLPAVREAFVFGSAARGEMSGSSDLDLALIVSDRGDPSDALEQIADEVWTRYGTRLSVIVGHGSLDAMTRSGRPGVRLWRQIATEAIPVFAGDVATG